MLVPNLFPSFILYAIRCYPIAGATFTTDTFLIPKIASANVGAMGFLLALLLRLYSGWGFVGSRLQSPMIEYEETGWYDVRQKRKKRLHSFIPFLEYVRTTST
jgi:hypothetical protein